MSIETLVMIVTLILALISTYAGVESAKYARLTYLMSKNKNKRIK